MEEETTTFYEVNRLPWPGGGHWVQELIYRVDNAGQVVRNATLSQEQHAALQALVDYRGPEARQARGNSLEEISSDSPEARLSLALALALLSPEKRQEYDQLQAQEARQETARALVEEAHKPVCFDLSFYIGEIDVLEDGAGLVEVIETGPNWTYRYTLYHLALAPEMSILEAYTPIGEHSINRHFQTTEKTFDESGAFDNFPATLAYLWRGLDWLTSDDEWTAEEVRSHDAWMASHENQGE